ncbi:ferritin-like domain-containing protein [Nocardia sp. NPDC088792]|uniref:ferritin-like domain-containing protein n=1 Tax=Nocardia sp. NPDC088792 TaxID=3364332 RepID=UPI00380B26D8
MNTRDTATLLAQLRAVSGLTHTEIQTADTRTAQARTEAVRNELSETADNARDRAASLDAAIRELGGVPELIGPFLGRAVATVRTIGEQARPFDEALLADLGLENQLLGRARYIKALATAAGRTELADLADRLITAHSATADWLTTVLAEEALGGPAALRRTPMQAVTGTAVQLVNVPLTWTARGLDRALDVVRTVPSALGDVLARGAHAGDVAVKALTASRDAALESAEDVTRREGGTGAADGLHSVRTKAGVLQSRELPITDFDDLNVSQVVAAIKELTKPSDVRAILAYEETNKDRQGVVSAAQTRLSTIAHEVSGINN